MTIVDWTDEKIELLKELWANGFSKGVISDRLACSRNSVSGKLHRLGLLNSRPKQPKKMRPRPRQIPSAKPPRSAFNPGPPKGRQPDHCFGVANTIKPWKFPPLTSDQKEFLLGNGKSLLDFDDLPSGPRYCRWPINEPLQGEKYLFCGHRIIEGCPQCGGYPYCGYHARMAYGRGTPSERRATGAG